jgi:IS605 OrfB family transposase
MKRTVKIKLEPDNDLVETIRQYSQIKQITCDYGLKSKTYNKNKLHRWLYKKLRKQFPDMPSAILQTARDVASETLKRTKFRNHIEGKEYSAMRLDKRNLRVNMEHGLISISSIKGRKKLTFLRNNPLILRYKDWSAVAGHLCFKNKQLYLNVVLQKESPIKIVTNKILGIDRGLNNIAVCSNNQFFNSAHLKDIKGKYQWLKSKLQAVGTPSARRKLKQIAGRERRFVCDMSHRLSKAIVNSEYNVFALEDLQKFRQDKGRKFNKKLGNWSFKQFERFLTYKAEELGKTVIKVNPKYTSQICSSCGHKDKANRKGNNFKCLNCGFELHADLNASRNIAQLGMSLLGRLQVNQPIVTPMAVTS